MKLATKWMWPLVALAFACGGGGPTKGSKATSASGAKEKAGSKATAATDKATMSGDTRDGVTCDTTIDGVGFCATDAQIVFCSGGNWWVLNCTAIDPKAFCGTDTAGVIDCWVAQ